MTDGGTVLRVIYRRSGCAQGLLASWSHRRGALSCVTRGLGGEEAKGLGVNTARGKICIILVATFVSALSVTIAGIIGWIGLIVPHIARFIFGADNRAVLASSAMIGAIFLLFCDSFSRLIFTFEIPIGIVTSLFGIPMFIIVLRRAKRSF